jgi:hypothetical protein
MNYFLVVIVVGMAGFAYYQHSEDEKQVADLQHQVADLKTKVHADPAANSHVSSAAAGAAGDDADAQPALKIAPAVAVVTPTMEHSSAIDAAAAAATAVESDPNNIGTLKTLDGRTFYQCKVIKVEADGITFSHQDGIAKVLLPFLPPNVQKQFDYDPQKAVAQADAQLRSDQQQSGNPSTPAPANP